jgi:RNA polymerase sigma-70 factor (ECF subfamily)
MARPSRDKRQGPPADPGAVGSDGAPLADRQVAYARYVIPEIEVLLRVALTMTAQPADAEDLVQDALLRAWRSLDTFDGQYPRAWLLTILRNAEVNRHRRRRPQLLDNPDLEPERAVSNDGPDASPESIIIDRGFDAAIDTALAELPEAFRQAVVLIDVGGLSYAEASAVLGVPEGTLMSRLHRARKRIRHRLGTPDTALGRRSS